MADAVVAVTIPSSNLACDQADYSFAGYTLLDSMADFAYDGRDLEAMSFAENYHAWILSEIRTFFGKKVAEIGAGSGSFSELILKEPIEELVAIEPSRAMYELLEAQTKPDTRVVCRNDFFENVSAEYQSHFDSIVYVNVLEHIEKDGTELSFVFNSLKPGGHVCIFVPALSWLYSEHDKSIGHHRRYNRRQLTALVRSAGFEIARVRYFDFIGVTAWLLMVKLFGKKPGAGNVKFYDTYLVPLSRFLESIIAPPVGKNLIVIGRKPN